MAADNTKQFPKWDDLQKAFTSDAIHPEGDVGKEFLTTEMSEANLPQGVVSIRNIDQLKATVCWARKHKMQLMPFSSASPHNNGCLGMSNNAVVVDLSPMKNIMSVDRRNRVAVMEAGVTFTELVPMVYRNNLRPMLPLMPRQGKSALASYLDREPTIYPKYQWDNSDPLLCLEVVFGSGDVFRTGSAAGPGSIQEQWAAGGHQKGPMGPGQNDWMKIIQGAQGSIALATWCSAKCEVLPKEEKLFLAGSSSLQTLVSASYRQFYNNLTDIHFIVDRNALANLLAENKDQHKTIREGKDNWVMIYSVSGIEHFAEKRMQYLAKKAESDLKAEGVKRVSPPVMGEDQMHKHITRIDRKNSNIFWKDNFMGAHKAVYFQTTMDRAQGFVNLFRSMAEDANIPSQRIASYLQPQLGGRCCHLEFIIAMDLKNNEEVLRIHTFCSEAAEPLIKKGAFFSRPHGKWAKPAMSAAKTSQWIYGVAKDIFDPDHILAPGRLEVGGMNNEQA